MFKTAFEHNSTYDEIVLKDALRSGKYGVITRDLLQNIN